jgi:predicted nucleic acid-binding Zn ribbon protein
VRNTAPNTTRRRRAAEVVTVALPDIKPQAWHREKSPARHCVICGEAFPARNFAKTCSPECSRQLWLAQQRKRYVANSEKILAQQRQRQRPIIRQCVVCGKEFDNRKGAKTCSPEHLREYRHTNAREYYLAHREKWVERERSRQAKWSPKPRQCVVCGEDFVVANRKNSRANACPKHRHDRKLQMERARDRARRGLKRNRSTSPCAS